MRAISMVTDIGGGSYTDKLTSLEEKRWMGDMIQTWRIVTGKDMVRVETWFDLKSDRKRDATTTRRDATTTRNVSQHHAIRPREYQHEDRGKFFSNRVVKDYNALPDHVKQASNINAFKNGLDKHRGTQSAGPLGRC